MSASELTSVVRVCTWPKVDDQYPIALFHKKFWGKSMEDEEAEWRKTQTQTQIGGQDRHEAMEEDEDQGREGQGNR